jgi:hypothetical protein
MPGAPCCGVWMCGTSGTASSMAAKAEYERKAVVPTPFSWWSVSIDGKHLATLSEERLRRLGKGDSDKPLSIDEPRAQMKRPYPWVQLCEQQSLVYGLIRAHSVALVSAAATIVLARQEIPGHSNEVGTIQSTVQALVDRCGTTSMVQLVMTDAGMRDVQPLHFSRERRSITCSRLQIITRIFSTRRNSSPGHERTTRQKPRRVNTRMVRRSFTASGPRPCRQDSCGGVMPDNSFASSVSVKRMKAKWPWEMAISLR